MKHGGHLYALLFVLLAGMMLGACGSPDSRTLAARPADESGIGGTGILAGEDGIGGTGIVGTVTGFGSIFVNGIEVEIPPRTRILVDGRAAPDHAFRRGEVVALRVARENGIVVAREAFVEHLVIGPLEIGTGDRLRVLGQTVVVNDGPLPAAGTRVAVSGFRDATGVIHATSVVPAPGAGMQVTGIPRRQGAHWYLGELKLTGLVPGPRQRVRVWGKPAAAGSSALRVTRVEALAPLPFSRPVGALIWQGFTHPLATGQYRLGERGLRAYLPVPLRSVLSAKTPVRLVLRAEGRDWRALLSLPEAGLPRGRPHPPGTHGGTLPGPGGGGGMPVRPPMPPPMRPPGGMW